MKYAILLSVVMILSGCIGANTPDVANGEKADLPHARAFVSGQFATASTTDATAPDDDSPQTTCEICNGSKRSGDGLGPCPCGGNCQCPKQEPPQVSQYIDVTMFIKDWCKACHVILDGFGANGDYTKPIILGRFRLIPTEDSPDWVKEYPTLFFKSETSPTGWRHVVGWPGLLEFTRIHDGLPVEDETQPEAYQQQFQSSSIWTYPGEIDSHLQSTHGFSAGEIRGLTRRQMEQLHSNEHERGNPRRNYRRLRRAGRAAGYQTYCPTCPN